MKNSPQLVEEKEPEVDPAKLAQQQFIKKNLKVDLIDSLKKIVHTKIYYRESILKINKNASHG